MSLFQNSVLKKYLKFQNTEELKEKWALFKAYFHNSTIQENIRELKEEEFQEGFVRELFVTVLGYTLNPSPDFNFVLEKKNVTDSRKADGAIIINKSVKAVIELKGTDTTDLSKVEVQAFGYKNNQPDCVYIVTSNFEKLRFYIENAVEHIEFNLFSLTEDEFNLLYVCLSYKNISANIAKKIKDESVSQEDKITKDLYNDYSLFKRELHHNLVALNPNYSPLLLFKKSQKLLDRFLFLFFAEDRQLLPPNSVRLILSDWKDIQERDEEVPLYSRFKKYFDYLNTGFKGKRYDVFAYNGGLFKPDEILDNIKINDDLLYKHTLKISDYDFASEVDVNILGHIFENSLNELDEIKAQLEGQIVDKDKTKRKKDGVFYTPKYITKYIVDNTIGKLCSEAKQSFAIVEEDYTTDRKRQIKTKRTLLDKLEVYRQWLLQMTICDPACGSGAFLNQALDFLIKEHQYIDELQAKVLNVPMVLSDIENSILENNLFGVDLNEESVEIAKLSLWLRTAQPNRKLNDLNNNIKCGNSLIGDLSIVDNAFNWQLQFPQVFEQGGFSVIIGNPPYVKEATNKNAFTLLHNHPCYQGKMDLWYFFGWLGLDIVKPNSGLIGYIAPNNWITNDGAGNFRNKIVNESVIQEFIDFGDYKVFESAGIQTMIYIMQKNSLNNDYTFAYSKILDKKLSPNEVLDFLSKKETNKTTTYRARIKKELVSNNILSFPNDTNNAILTKIENNANFRLESSEVNSGIDIGQDFLNGKSKEILGEGFNIGDGVFNLSNAEFSNYNFSDSEKKLLKPFYTTKEINRYFVSNENKYWVIYTDSKFKNPLEILPYPNLKGHLDKFEGIITSDNKPYGLHRSRNENIFLGEKILSIRKCQVPSFSYVNFDSYINRTYNVIKSSRINLKYLTAILNSRVVKFWLREKGKLQGDALQVDINPILSIPIIYAADDIGLIDMVDKITALVNDLKNIQVKFENSIKRKFNLSELPNNLLDWHTLSYSDFINELGKKKIKLNLSDEAEWETYFTTEMKKVLELKAKVSLTDKEIDQLVYKLYNLTEDEIKIVDNI